jgi:hypothetical protein
MFSSKSSHLRVLGAPFIAAMYQLHSCTMPLTNSSLLGIDGTSLLDAAFPFYNCNMHYTDSSLLAMQEVHLSWLHQFTIAPYLLQISHRKKKRREDKDKVP